MATSVVPAVAKAIIARLSVRPGLTGVQITNGMPFQPDGDFIAILGVPTHEQTPSGMRHAGLSNREEQFTITIEIASLRTGDSDHTQVVDRVYVLAAELEADLAEDPTINGTLGTGWAYVEGLPHDKLGPAKDGRREARLSARVACHTID